MLVHSPNSWNRGTVESHELLPGLPMGAGTHVFGPFSALSQAHYRELDWKRSSHVINQGPSGMPLNHNAGARLLKIKLISFFSYMKLQCCFAALNVEATVHYILWSLFPSLPTTLVYKSAIQPYKTLYITRSHVLSHKYSLNRSLQCQSDGQELALGTVIRSAF